VLPPEYPLLVLIDFEHLCLDMPAYLNLRQEVLEAALESLTGMPLSVELDQGCTDFTLMSQALANFGLDGDKFLGYHTFKAAEEALIKQMVSRLPDSLASALRPGVTGVFIECESSKRAVVAPLTNHVEGVVKLLIARAHLGMELHLSCGAYSRWQAVRNDLVMMARQRAGLTGAPWPAERTLVITTIEDDLQAAASQEVRSVFIGSDLDSPNAALGATHSLEALHDVLPLLPAWIKGKV
jgi:hypothetical protein